MIYFFPGEYYIRRAYLFNVISESNSIVRCSLCTTRVGRKLIEGRFHMDNVALLEMKPVFVRVPRGAHLMMDCRVLSGMGGNNSGTLIDPGLEDYIPSPEDPDLNAPSTSGGSTKRVRISPVSSNNFPVAGTSSGVVQSQFGLLPEFQMSDEAFASILHTLQAQGGDFGANANIATLPPVVAPVAVEAVEAAERVEPNDAVEAAQAAAASRELEEFEAAWAAEAAALGVHQK